SFATFCGSLRRFSETCGDIDVVGAADAGSAAAVMDALVCMPLVDRVLGRGDTKTSVVTQRGLQIDVRVVAAEQLGAALLYFTGSKAHNVKLRQRALARGLTLNEYALSKVVESSEAGEAGEAGEVRDVGEVVARETEEQIYAALGLPFIPPTLREDAGELEAAEAGTLPRPLGAVVGDFHVHTTVSGDGRSPIEDVIAMAKARGLRVLALTDHAEGTVAGVSRDKLLAQRAQIRGLQAQLGTSLILLHGVELNIGPNGELDYDLEFRRGFDWCVASVHDHFDLDRAAQTKRVVTAMQDPTVRMIGHLTARMIGARPGIELDADAIFAAATATGTALEINGALPRLDLSVDWLRRARGRDVTFLLSSDAHRAEELARTDHAKLNAERAGLDPARVLNAGPPDRLIDWLREKRPA
ncbi:MAG: polymerase family, partial [Myxococcales bacterium]|nr:polymerase family [Myxococcales bacterium]